MPPLILLACLDVPESEPLGAAIEGKRTFSDYPLVRDALSQGPPDWYERLDDSSPLVRFGRDYWKHVRSHIAERNALESRRAERGRKRRVIEVIVNGDPTRLADIAMTSGISGSALEAFLEGDDSALSDTELSRATKDALSRA